MRIIFTLFITLLLSFSSLARASETPLETNSFAKIPILHDGRVKPMESFANAIIKPLTGSNNQATQTLIKMLFNPAKTQHDEIIRVTHPDVVTFLDLEKRKSRRYSYVELSNVMATHEASLQSILNTPSVQLTAAQKELTHLYEQTLIMRDILGSLILFAPLSNIDWQDIPDDLKPSNLSAVTYLDLLPIRAQVHSAAQKIARDRGIDFNAYNGQEKAIATLSFALVEIEKPRLYSQRFKVLSKLSPWDIIRQDMEHPSDFKRWQMAVTAYSANNWQAWNTAITDIIEHSAQTNTLKVENAYNQLQPLYLSALLYCLALILLTIQSFSMHALSHKAFIAISGGAVFHIIALAMRSFILMRPPVSTLYESILFVSLVIVLYGLILFYKNRNNVIALSISAGFGTLLYLLAYFNDQSGDTLLMLSAVLNTNFWLATHVLVITAGYGFCLMTSGFAHYALIKPSKMLNDNIQKAALWSLLLCTLGTILGGIWADQSWGRFWGWDPKENGALLIVLWLIWLLHAKITKHIGEKLFNAGLAYLSVIVMLSWFGVNLLSIGLHAYGFTDAALWWLIGFITFETVFIGYLLRRAR